MSHVQLIASDDPTRPVGGQLHLDQAAPATATFFLGQAFPPVPPKLVKKIHALEFMDVADLLTDNLELLRETDGASPSANLTTSKRRPHQVSNILSWVQCFTTYAAIVMEEHPQKARDLLAYLRLIVREAQTNENEGWREYDVAFRRYAAANPSLPWGQPLPSLYTTCVLAGRSLRRLRRTARCVWKCNHTTAHCALASHLPPVIPGRATRGAAASRFAPYPHPPPRESVDFSAKPICRKWNAGSCRGFPTCTYRHACIRCEKRGHKAADCPDSGGDSSAASSRSTISCGKRWMTVRTLFCRWDGIALWLNLHAWLSYVT